MLLKPWSTMRVFIAIYSRKRSRSRLLLNNNGINLRLNRLGSRRRLRSRLFVCFKGPTLFLLPY